MQNLKMCLWHKTGHEWDEISELYLNFRRQGAPFGKMCVFTSDSKTAIKPRYYIPKQAKRLHDPHEFVARYLNAKARIATQMPWVQFDLGEFPAVIHTQLLPDGSIIKASITLSGKIKLRPQRSQNNLTLSKGALTTIVADAKLEAANLFTTGFEVSIDILTQKLSVSISGTNGDYSSSLTVNYLEIEAELDLPPLNFSNHGWDVELNASISFKGTIEDKPPTAPQITLDKIEQGWHQSQSAMINVAALVRVIALIIFDNPELFLAAVA